VPLSRFLQLGFERFKVNSFIQFEPLVKAQTTSVNVSIKLPVLAAKLAESLNELSSSLKDFLGAKLQKALQKTIESVDPSTLPDLVCSLIDIKRDERLDMLSTVKLKDRIEKAIHFTKRQIQVVRITSNVRNIVATNEQVKQREAALRSQLESIKRQLGNSSVDEKKGDELEVFGKKIESGGNLSEEAKRIANRELKRVKTINPSNSEYNVIMNFLSWLVDLPFKSSGLCVSLILLGDVSEVIDLVQAERLLNEDHYGLDKIKRRILEYLAVRKLNVIRNPAKNVKAPILCFVGPPGVGKTSLGKSIARTMNRAFHRISLGGVRDEAEIRGHRRTYVGAMPGLIVQALRKVKVPPPVYNF
jgi:ATP-dependent Lon protease